nr:MAG TPA: hypothetical protein [Caudoviricetes sp.]
MRCCNICYIYSYKFIFTKGSDKMTKKQLEVKAKVEAEEQRLHDIFKSANATETALALKCIQNLAFMSVQLEELQNMVYKTGVVEKYKNGENQYGTKQSSALQSYNNLLKTFNVTLRTLTSDIIKNISVEEKDELQMFMEKFK